jgi:hypothetical protein
MMREHILLLIALAGVAQPLSGQFARTERAGLSQTGAHTERERPRFVTPRTDGESHWLEGGIVTGTLAAAVGVLFFFDARDEPDGPSILLFPVAVAIPFLAGFTPGALLGSLIPKS